MNIFRRLLQSLLAISVLSGCSTAVTNTAAIESVNDDSRQPKASDLVTEKDSQQPHIFLDFQLGSNFTQIDNESKYPYYKLNSKFNGHLTGKLYMENTQVSSKITLIVMQGRNTVLITEKGKEQWGKFLNFTSTKDETINIDLDIKWDKDGSEEIIVFPLIDSFTNYYYMGAHASVIRLFVGDNKDYHFSNKQLQAMAFDKNQELRLIPDLMWLNSNNQRISIKSENDHLFTDDSYHSLLITSLIKEATFDIVYLNELGESEILFKGFNQEINKDTVITFNKEMMESFLNKDMKQFVLVVNNENEKMLLDIMAVNQDINSITTSFQALIQIVPLK